MAHLAKNSELRPFQWKNRLLLVFAPSTSDQRYLEQTQEFGSHAVEFSDRDIIMIQIFDHDESRVDQCPLNSFESNALKERFGIRKGQFMIILVGKDGGQKLRASSPVPLSEILALIDSMPMRQQEMRQTGG